MKQELIITNGDSAADLLKEAKIGDHWLPWRDVLHEGPVPFTDDLSSLSLIRSKYLADKGWADSEQVGDDFKQRDDLVKDASRYENVVLWFEHDLYDQLQLIQILDFFASCSGKKDYLYLVQADDFLGHQTPQTIGRFLERKRQVAPEQFKLAQEAWLAFRQSTPESIVALLGKDLSALPFLKPSVQRMLEELPSISSGISRTEKQILTLVDESVSETRKLFHASQEMEEAPFMGDWSFFDRLMGLSHCKEPLVSGLENFSLNGYKDEKTRRAFLTTKLKLTEFGKAVRLGTENHARQNDIHFWWGGTEISATNLWCWDSGKRQLIFS